MGHAPRDDAGPTPRRALRGAKALCAAIAQLSRQEKVCEAEGVPFPSKIERMEAPTTTHAHRTHRAC
jgi:hypothetical protein